MTGPENTEVDFGHDGRKIKVTMEGGLDDIFFVDSWGAGPFSLRVGRRRYYFTDSDMFGPLLETKHGRVISRQPKDNSQFWPAYTMWRKLGRRGRKVDRWIICRWRAPKAGRYWVGENGLSHFICDPEYDPLGYTRVSRP